jgi:hypothetical protein
MQHTHHALAAALVLASGCSSDPGSGAPTQGMNQVAERPGAPTRLQAETDTSGIELPSDYLANATGKWLAAGYPSDGLVGNWARGSGAMFKVVDWTSSSLEGYHYDSQGSADIFRFYPDASYRFFHMERVKTGSCASGKDGWEVGTFTFDGTTLAVSPKHSRARVWVCTASNAKTYDDRDLEPREHTVNTYLLSDYDGKHSVNGIGIEGPCVDAWDLCGSSGKPRSFLLQKVR